MNHSVLLSGIPVRAVCNDRRNHRLWSQINLHLQVWLSHCQARGFSGAVFSSVNRAIMDTSKRSVWVLNIIIYLEHLYGTSPQQVEDRDKDDDVLCLLFQPEYNLFEHMNWLIYKLLLYCPTASSTISSIFSSNRHPKRPECFRCSVF